ncbi:hypothetical protein TNIN_263781 [Trichonephila inaurata madagascariensis]|uniref:Uncharacterized protein n=1 Tax=Trichonephila inaurata madagascariensis TaxID=2747483 RepID=A0A8X6YV26_9ARAC|nr:hypothetical protein TNIN_263781 [Trichonephila inaurata madagascariensis]
MLREEVLLLDVENGSKKRAYSQGSRVSASWNAEKQLFNWLPEREEAAPHWLTCVCLKDVYIMVGRVCSVGDAR